MFKNINFLRPVLAILILFIPLYPKFPLASVTGTYVAIRLDDIVVALAVLIFAIYQIKNKFPIFKEKIFKLFLVYWLTIIATTLNAVLVYQTDPTNILLLNLFRRFEYMSLFFITIYAIKDKSDIKFSYIFMVIATVFVSIYGYGQKFLRFPTISTMNEEFSKGQLLQMDVWSRISSTFAGHYDLACYLSAVLVVMGCVTLLLKNIPAKIFTLIVWLAAFQILNLTASRVSTFAFWGGICITLFLLRKYLWIIPVSAIVVFSIVNSKDLNQRLLATIPAITKQFEKKPTAAPTIIPTIAPVPTTAITAITTAPTKHTTPIPTVIRHPSTEEVIPVDTDAGVARSGEIRFQVEWPRAINAFRKNYIIGTGLGSLTLATDNDYLRLLGESGSLGFISFFAILLFFIIKTIPVVFKKTRTFNDNLSIILMGGLVTTLANAMFIDVFEASKTAYLFWIMMGVYYQNLKFSSNK